MTRIFRTLAVAAVLLSAAVPAHALDKDGKFVVVIDAGHGGKDPGAVNGRNQEKTINLNVALKLGRLIEENCADVKVLYTRKTDVFVELYRRAEIANKADADFFISIHTNAAKSKSAVGAETYLLGIEENRTSANFNVAIEENKAILLENDYEAHYEGYDPNVPESQIIFEFMQNEYQKESLKMATMVQNEMTGTPKRHDRGVHQAGYLVLWKSAMPSILVELGFISNDAECRYLTSQKGIDEMSGSLFRAFSAYHSEYMKQLSKALPPSSAIGRRDSDQPAETSKTGPNVVFKIQFMTLSAEIKSDDSRIKGLPEVSHFKEDGKYKYTCGDTSDYEEICRTRDEVRKRYKDAFITAYVDGRKVSVKEALDMTGKK